MTTAQTSTKKSAGKKAKAEGKTPVSQKLEKPAKEKAPKPPSCLDAAAHVLKAKGESMRCKEMIEAIFAEKLWHTDAPTPAATLYSAILREMKTKGKEARFKKTERGHFALNA